MWISMQLHRFSGNLKSLAGHINGQNRFAGWQVERERVEQERERVKEKEEEKPE